MASPTLIAAAFRDRVGSAPAVIASAPGRVNLIGEHTDYSEGFVLPMAIEARAFVAMAPSDGATRIHSAQLAGMRVLESGAADAPGTDWSDIPAGVIREFERLDWDTSRAASPACALQLPGEVRVDVLIDSSVPIGLGLSSSAAIEMALARALCELAGRPWIPLEMARLGQRVEHQAGVRSGMMDQVVVGGAHEGAAMLLDCRTFDPRAIALPRHAAIVVMDTGVRRALGASGYNARRSACEEAVAVIRRTHRGVRALRDVTPAMLAEGAGDLSPEQLRRARHVVTENSRVLEFASALASGNLEAAGALLNASHASLRDDYEVSSAHLDTVCDLARAHPACFGARLTGAGFGGCAIALVHDDAVPDFIAAVQPRYEAATYQRSTFFRARPSGGARIDARTGTPEGRSAG